MLTAAGLPVRYSARINEFYDLLNTAFLYRNVATSGDYKLCCSVNRNDL
jgi:hypothetical protein